MRKILSTIWEKTPFFVTASAIAIFASSCDFRGGDSKATVSEALESLSGKNADWKKAKTLAEKATKQNPDDFRAKILLAGAYEQNGQISSAVDELKKAVKLAPEDFTAQYTLGRIYFESGKYDDCLAPLIQANKLDPKNASATFYLARTYHKLHQNKNALLKYKELAMMPDFKKRPEPFNEMGVILAEQKDYKNSILCLIAAYRRAPDDHKVIWNLALFYDVYGRNPASAINFYNKFQEVSLVNPELEAKRAVARKRVKSLETATTKR
ncbi:MAG TPA: tetratricopeptide repeat protein [Victivallales bacterium]|nr:tetratricopeptide repeat protein [Victivallales bacterium]